METFLEKHSMYAENSSRIKMMPSRHDSILIKEKDVGDEFMEILQKGGIRTVLKVLKQKMR